MSVIGHEFELFVRLDPSWVTRIDRDVFVFALVGPWRDGIGICGFRMDLNADSSGFSWTPVDRPSVLKIDPGDVLILSFGKNAIFHELFEGDDSRLELYREAPTVKKYREKVLGRSRPSFTEREIRSLLRTSIEVTEREWLNFYPAPVAVHRPIDIAEVGQRSGFRWVTKLPPSYNGKHSGHPDHSLRKGREPSRPSVLTAKPPSVQSRRIP